MSTEQSPITQPLMEKREQNQHSEEADILITTKAYPTRINKYNYGGQLTCIQKCFSCSITQYALTRDQVRLLLEICI